jgi:hypothetical protein
MGFRFKINKAAFFALCCLVFGGAKPAYTLISVIAFDNRVELQQFPDDLGDGEEEDENDGDDENYKMLQPGLVVSSVNLDLIHETTYSHGFFSEHFLETITPPPWA